MKISSIISSIYSQIQLWSETPKKIINFVVPSFSSIKLSSRTLKALIGISISIPAAFVAYRHFSKSKPPKGTDSKQTESPSNTAHEEKRPEPSEKPTDSSTTTPTKPAEVTPHVASNIDNNNAPTVNLQTCTTKPSEEQIDSSTTTPTKPAEVKAPVASNANNNNAPTVNLQTCTTKPSEEQIDSSTTTSTKPAEVTVPVVNNVENNISLLNPTPKANLEYLQTFMDENTISAECRELFISILSAISRGDENIKLSHGLYIIPLLKILQPARIDLKNKNNPQLLETINTFLLSEVDYSLEKFSKQFLLVGNINDLTQQAINELEKTKDSGVLPPFLMIVIGLYYLKQDNVDAFSKAAFYYQLGLLRMRKDFETYKKGPQSLIQIEKINKDLGSDLEANILKEPSRKKWNEAQAKATKEAEELDKTIPYTYDPRWVLWAQTCRLDNKSDSELTVVSLDGVCEKGFSLQETFWKAFVNEPRFQPKREIILNAPVLDPTAEANLKYLQTFMKEDTISPECRGSLISILSAISQGDKDIKTPPLLILPLLKILEPARIDLEKSQNNPKLLEVINSLLSAEAVRSLRIFSNQCAAFNNILSLKSKRSVDELEKLKECGVLPPFLWIAMGLYYLEQGKTEDDFSKAAAYYQLGLLRMEKDFKIYEKDLSLIQTDEINKNLGSDQEAKVQVNESSHTMWKQAQVKAKKEAEKLDQIIPYTYDPQWVIWAQVSYSDSKSAQVSNKELFKELLDGGLSLQRTFWNTLVNERRFQPTEKISLDAPVVDFKAEDDLDYLSTFMKEDTISADCREPFISILSAISRGDKEIQIPHFIMPLLKILQPALTRGLKEKNLQLFENINKFLSSEVSDSIEIFSDQYLMLHKLLPNSTVSNSMKELTKCVKLTREQIIEELKKNLESTFPFLLIALGLSCLKSKKSELYSQAAVYYQLGLLRMKKDFDTYKLHPIIQTKKIDQLFGSGQVSTIKPEKSVNKKWTRAQAQAIKEAEELDKTIPYAYDPRWVIWAQAYGFNPTTLANTFSPEQHCQTIVNKSLFLQSLCWKAFVDDPRFQPRGK